MNGGEEHWIVNDKWEEIDFTCVKMFVYRVVILRNIETVQRGSHCLSFPLLAYEIQQTRQQIIRTYISEEFLQHVPIHSTLVIEMY